MAQINDPNMARLTAFHASLPPCPNGCSRDAVYPTPTFNPRDSIEDQVTIHIRKTRQNQDWLLRMHVFETHRYGHLQAASEYSADVRRDVDRLLGRLTEAEAQVARVRAFLEDMAGWCSPHVVAADYSRRGLDALDGVDSLGVADHRWRCDGPGHGPLTSSPHASAEAAQRAYERHQASEHPLGEQR